jgi:hypothetical protein
MELSKVGTTQATTGFERLLALLATPTFEFEFSQAGPLPCSRIQKTCDALWSFECLRANGICFVPWREKC